MWDDFPATIGGWGAKTPGEASQEKIHLYFKFQGVLRVIGGVGVDQGFPSHIWTWHHLTIYRWSQSHFVTDGRLKTLLE